jgi:diacylglycerol kinase family enzyme
MSVVLESAAARAAAAPAGAGPELFIVMNEGSRSAGRQAVRETLRAVLEEAGRPHRFVPVGTGGIVRACQEAARLASAQGGALVAVGGDGTLNCAAQAALTHDCPLGVIAQGTFNLFARELGLPLDAAEATCALLRAQPRPVQVGWVNQRAFLVNASVGLYPKLLADRERVKQKLGRQRWIALLAAVRSLLEWRWPLQVEGELDGHVGHLRTSTIFVCNNRLQLERVGIAPDIVAQVGTGKLAGLLVRSERLPEKLRLLAGALLGRLGREREIHSFALRSLTVGSRNARRLKVATDGEVQWMELPLRFTVAPRPLKVLLPPRPEAAA